MTLTSSTSIPPASLTGETPRYLIFFSSGNPPWCPDCVDAQPAINHVFGTSADAHLVLVDRPDWKSPDNIFRTQYGIKCIPTITKMINVSANPSAPRKCSVGCLSVNWRLAGQRGGSDRGCRVQEPRQRRQVHPVIITQCEYGTSTITMRTSRLEAMYKWVRRQGIT